MKREDIKVRATQRDCEWSIEWECPIGTWHDNHPCAISFKISDASNGGTLLLTGWIKSDGCSNWMEPTGSYFHLCGLKSVEALHAAMSMCYKVAAQYMPEVNE